MGFLGGLIRAGVAGYGGALKGANQGNKIAYQREQDRLNRERQTQQDALQAYLLQQGVENTQADNQRADEQLRQQARANQVREVLAKRQAMLDSNREYSQNHAAPPLYDPNNDPVILRGRQEKKEGLGVYRPDTTGTPSGMSGGDITREGSVRKEYSDQVKTYDELGRAYRKIQQAAADPSPAGDLSMIFGFMRILDPASTVREGEFATAQNTGTIPQQITAQYNKLLSGEGRLSAAQRADFVRQATGLIQSQRSTLKGIQDRYTGIAKSYGMNPANVVYDPFAGTGENHVGGASSAGSDDPVAMRMADRFEEIRAQNPGLPAAQITQMVKDEFSRKNR